MQHISDNFRNYNYSCLKVKNTDDLIEINLDKDRPESFESHEAKLEWEMASARKALKFKKRVESGEFIPPEIKKKLEEKERMSEEDKVMVAKERQLERRKQKLRWLKIEQKLVDIDIAVKTALHLERPAPDRFLPPFHLSTWSHCYASFLLIASFLLTGASQRWRSWESLLLCHSCSRNNRILSQQ